MKRKMISAVMALLMLSAVNLSVTAFAEESAEAAETTATAETAETAETTDSTAETASAESNEAEAETTQSAEDSMIEEILDSVENDNSANDDNKYYTDDYYDTEGNATLIKEEQVIYESEEMQFIAVTTKDGAVFYILINYSAASDENNVYFLNKVDTLDLYSLLYMTDDEEESGIDLDRVQQAEQAALDHNSMNTADDSAEETSEGEDTSENEAAPAQSGSMNSTMLLGIGLVALIAIGFIGFKLVKKKPAAKQEVDTDFDDQDDYEVNEDDEDF